MSEGCRTRCTCLSLRETLGDDAIEKNACTHFFMIVSDHLSGPTTSKIICCREESESEVERIIQHTLLIAAYLVAFTGSCTPMTAGTLGTLSPATFVH